jgi:hypothetical protein
MSSKKRAAFGPDSLDKKGPGLWGDFGGDLGGLGIGGGLGDGPGPGLGGKDMLGDPSKLDKLSPKLDGKPSKLDEKMPEGFELFLQELKTAENPDEAFKMIVKFLDLDGKGEKKDVLKDKKEGPSHEMKESPAEEKKEEKEEGGKKDDAKEEFFKASSEKEDEKEDKKEDEKEDSKEDKKEDKKEEAKEDKKEDEKKDAAVSPKLKFKAKDPASARLLTVKASETGTVIAYFDNKPILWVASGKEDKVELQKFATKLKGWLVYNGLDAAVKQFGAKKVAGVDDMVELDSDVDVKPNENSAIDNADDSIDLELAKPADSITDNAVADSQVSHDKVEAGVEDGATFDTKETHDERPKSVLQDHEDDTSLKLDKPAEDIRDKAQPDFKNLEANYRKLYKERAQKLVKSANSQFVDRFIRVMKIAAKRMLLNYEENPYKAATLDILVDNGLDPVIASDFCEKIAKVGHDQFVAALLDSTASLIAKSDEYLKDLESDLENLSVKPVSVVSKKSSKVEKLREEATEGNFLVKPSTSVSRAENNNPHAGIRAAIRETTVGRRISRLSGE